MSNRLYFTAPGPLKPSFDVRTVLTNSTSSPWNVVFGIKGEIIVSEHHLHRLQVFDTQGKSIKFIGKYGKKPGNMNFPVGLAVKPNGNIVVGEYGNNRIQIFDGDGKSVKIMGEQGSHLGGSEDMKFYGIYDIALTREGNIAVTDNLNDRIQIVSPEGQFLMKISVSRPQALKLDLVTGNFIVGGNEGTLSIFSPEGVLLRSAPKSDQAYSVGIDREGNIIVPDRDNKMIRIYNQNLELKMCFQGDLERPYSAMVDRHGNIIVCDNELNQILMFGCK
jgi:DNA-binding beta-propeller fold protein YncE